MNEENVILVDAKNGYTNRLINLLYRHIHKGIESMYNDAKDSDSYEPLEQFRKHLKNVPAWNQKLIEEETKRIIHKSKCSELPKLFAAVYLSNIRILIAVKMKSDKIELKIPKFSTFIHACYTECSRDFYLNPFLFDDEEEESNKKLNNVKESIDIIKKSIENAVMSLLPYDTILEQYLGNCMDKSDNEDSDSEVDNESVVTESDISDDDIESSYSENEEYFSEKSVDKNEEDRLSSEKDADKNTNEDSEKTKEDFEKIKELGKTEETEKVKEQTTETEKVEEEAKELEKSEETKKVEEQTKETEKLEEQAKETEKVEEHEKTQESETLEESKEESEKIEEQIKETEKQESDTKIIGGIDDLVFDKKIKNKNTGQNEVYTKKNDIDNTDQFNKEKNLDNQMIDDIKNISLSGDLTKDRKRILLKRKKKKEKKNKKIYIPQTEEITEEIKIENDFLQKNTDKKESNISHIKHEQENIETNNQYETYLNNEDTENESNNLFEDAEDNNSESD